MENLASEASHIGKISVRQKSESEVITCPACKAVVNPTDMKNHCDLEVDRLIKFQLNEHASKSGNASSYIESSLWNTFQKVQNNRQSRLKTKTRKRVSSEPICPICNERPTGDISTHVEKCLENSTRESSSGDDDSIDIEGESFEEYEWAGQKRIRASSLLQGGYAAIGVGIQIRNQSNKDEDEDLNVDDDDTQIYGPCQYGDDDVLLQNIDENDEKIDRANCATEQKSSSQSSSEGTAQVLESLKSKIREYEIQINNKTKCLICLDEFRNPAVSVSCWHVHCEECWLRTLGARRLCPQCNIITSPGDLRRIYM